MPWLRRLYDWVLSWADSRYGTAALALIAFAESSVFPIPPDVLLIALVLGDRKKAFQFASVCSAASILGGIAGYAIGWGLWQAVDQWFFTYVPGFTVEKFDHVGSIYERWNFWVIFVAAFTPLPYKVITISAGVFGINVVAFVIATIVGRSARFFLVSGLLFVYGEPIKEFIDRRFNLLTIAFVILLIGGFLLVELVPI